MSWSVTFASRGAFEADTPTTGTIPETDQYPRARQAAEGLIASGAVGSDEKDFTVNLSGHSNPDHQPTPGWANDCITVSVTQKL